MKPEKLKSVRYGSALISQRHLIVAIKTTEHQRLAGLRVREWVNGAEQQINQTIERLCSIVHDAPRFVVRFKHSQTLSDDSDNTWSSILERVAEHHADSVRVLVRFSRPQKQTKSAGKPKDILPSHLLGVQIGKCFDIDDDREICNLAVEIPYSREAFQNLLSDVAADIFLFHHFVQTSWAAHGGLAIVAPHLKRAMSEEKLRYAERQKLSFYGWPMKKGALASATYISFAGCARQSVTASSFSQKDAVQHWEAFIDEQFPKMVLSIDGKKSTNTEIAKSLADSLLSLTKIGGQLSKIRIMKQIRDHLDKGPADLTFCFLHRSPPPRVSKMVSSLLGRRCRHRVLALSAFPAAAQLAPYVLSIRIYRRTPSKKEKQPNG